MTIKVFLDFLTSLCYTLWFTLDQPYYGMCYPLSEQNRSQVSSPVMVRRSTPVSPPLSPHVRRKSPQFFGFVLNTVLKLNDTKQANINFSQEIY